MAFHSDETVGSIHVPYNWEYADATARNAATGFVADDVGKLARQLDDNSIWLLTGYSPVTWVQMGGNDSAAIHKAISGEISALTLKATPVGADHLLIEDSAASDAKKRTTFGGISHTLLADKGTNTHAQVDSHIGSTSNPHSVTKAQVGLTNVTDDAQLKRAAGDINSFTAKGTPVSNDLILIEDSADSNNKKKITVGSLPSGGTDSNAIHKNVAAEISTITEKTSLVGADLFVIEDSAASNAKKRVQATNLPPDSTAIHKATAAEISAMTEKTVPVNADLFVIEDSAASNAKKKLQIGNLPMAYIASGASESESSTTSSSFQQKLSVTFTATSGIRYVIFYSMEIGKAADEDVEGRMQLNDTTTIAQPYYKNPPYATRYAGVEGGHYVSDSLSGTINVDMDWRNAYGSGAAYIRRARIVVLKVNN